MMTDISLVEPAKENTLPKPNAAPKEQSAVMP